MRQNMKIIPSAKARVDQLVAEFQPEFFLLLLIELLGQLDHGLVIERDLLEREFVFAGGVGFNNAERALHDAAQALQFLRRAGNGFAFLAGALKSLCDEHRAGNSF